MAKVVASSAKSQFVSGFLHLRGVPEIFQAAFMDIPHWLFHPEKPITGIDIPPGVDENVGIWGKALKAGLLSIQQSFRELQVVTGVIDVVGIGVF